MTNTRVAIVTGGAGEGIGAGISVELAKRGWSLVVVDKDRARTLDLTARLASRGCVAEAHVVDVTSPEAPASAVGRAIERFGRLDGLVNSAGIGMAKPVGEFEDGDFDRLFDLDFRAVFRFCRAALPELRRRGGAIVNVSSIHSRQSIPGYGLYAACKAAVEALTRGIAIDYGPDGVRANCVSPGFVMSAQNRALIASFAPDPDAWIAAYLETKQCLPRFVTNAEIGRAVAWLLDSENETITGQSIVVDGGTTSMAYERERK